MRKLIYISACAIFLALTSCSVRLVDFTVISSKNVALKIDKEQGKRTQGSSMGFLGLGVSIKDAIDDALHNAGGSGYDMLLDGVVRRCNYFFVAGFKVEGTAVNTSKMKAQLGEKGFDEWCKVNHVLDPETAKAE